MTNLSYLLVLFLVIEIFTVVIALDCYRCIYWEGKDGSQADCRESSILRYEYLINCENGASLTSDDTGKAPVSIVTSYCGLVNTTVENKRIIYRTCYQYYKHDPSIPNGTCRAFQHEQYVIVNGDKLVGKIPSNKNVCYCTGNRCNSNSVNDTSNGNNLIGNGIIIFIIISLFSYRNF